MKVFKLISLIVLSIVDIYFLYSTIGYLILGIKTPVILGENNTNFMGMYIMSFIFFCLFVLLSLIILIIFIKQRKNKKK